MGKHATDRHRHRDRPSTATPTTPLPVRHHSQPSSAVLPRVLFSFAPPAGRHRRCHLLDGRRSCTLPLAHQQPRRRPPSSPERASPHATTEPTQVRPRLKTTPPARFSIRVVAGPGRPDGSLAWALTGLYIWAWGFTLGFGFKSWAKDWA
ncbi:hypothetical protein Tsubulata_020671 [Turnera subulata]|uniref:Uncharacterized protein n=1 Tax=Turnera subulata TaxID=218843 RepID=A0A9Q0JJB0_9ROSI|nr:hypothetical protein Tsubulata_020671 [Turnera subulata]